MELSQPGAVTAEGAGAGPAGLGEVARAAATSARGLLGARGPPRLGPTRDGAAVLRGTLAPLPRERGGLHCFHGDFLSGALVVGRWGWGRGR